jgi:hypothetical protein
MRSKFEKIRSLSDSTATLKLLQGPVFSMSCLVQLEPATHFLRGLALFLIRGKALFLYSYRKLLQIRLEDFQFSRKVIID